MQRLVILLLGQLLLGGGARGSSQYSAPDSCSPSAGPCTAHQPHDIHHHYAADACTEDRPCSEGNPGIVLQLRQEAFDLFGDMFVRKLHKQLKRVPLENMEKEVGIGNYRIDKLQIRSFFPPSYKVTIRRDKGVILTLKSLSVYVTGNWKISSAFSQEGNIDISSKNNSITVLLKLEKDLERHPKARVEILNHKSGPVAFDLGKVTKGDSTFSVWDHYNGDKKLTWHINNNIEEWIQAAIKYVIRKDAATFLFRITSYTPLYAELGITTLLTQTPTYGDEYMEISIHGEGVWMLGPQSSHTEAPLINNSSGPVGSVRVLISDYVLSTMAAVLHKQDLLKLTLTGDKLGEYKDTLQLSCGVVGMCIGSIMPNTLAKYPNGLIGLSIHSTSAPSITIGDKTVMAKLFADAKFEVSTPGEKSKELFVSPISINIDIQLSSQMKKQVFKFKIQDMRLDVKVIKDPEEEPTLGEKLMPFIQPAVSMFIVPKINKLGMEGFSLPDLPFPGVKITDAKLKLVQGSIESQLDLARKV